MGKHLVSTLLLALLLAVQAQLWLGRGSLPAVRHLRAELASQLEKNAQAIQAGQQLEAEVSDLKDGLEVVEENARMNLGMVKANEVYVRVLP